MPLTVGDRLGPYEVLAAIGSGGMGAVYRARDTKLNRDVALKVLPDLFAHDPERLARFQREAHVLAALNHPHIAQIYGLEESNGVRALVMEFVEGQTLAEVIARTEPSAVGVTPRGPEDGRAPQGPAEAESPRSRPKQGEGATTRGSLEPKPLGVGPRRQERRGLTRIRNS
jgi:hypothetical protein